MRRTACTAFRRRCRGAALAVLIAATSAAVAEGKVIWDDTAPSVLPRRDAHDRCVSAPLARAEFLARRSALISQGSRVIVVPYPWAPYLVVVPAPPVAALWTGPFVGASTRSCDPK